MFGRSRREPQQLPRLRNRYGGRPGMKSAWDWASGEGLVGLDDLDEWLMEYETGADPDHS